MKILLDESLPRKLRNDFGDFHEVFSVRDMGWLGKKVVSYFNSCLMKVSICLLPSTGIYGISKT